MISLDRLKVFLKTLPEGVNLLAVSKGQSSVSIEALFEAGQIDFGESKLQEALQKFEELKHLIGIRWHFIGRLQSNKVRGVVKNFDVIHSVDSLKLAERISRVALEEDKELEILLQVKFREDSNKTGFAPKDLLEQWDDLERLPNLYIVGLMTMAPKNLESNHRKVLFQDCRLLANELGLKDCSMGMSEDWQEAVEAGSTWIRVGAFLFGDRA